ncbi:MAG: carboxypeptidase-like regulatory domain-containing protein, partial [Flavobacteriaceae bacterium]
MQATVRSVFLIVFVLFLTNLKAQQVLNGTISDKISGEPIPGATILIKGSSIGTSADFDGLFSLPNVNLGDQL